LQLGKFSVVSVLKFLTPRECVEVFSELINLKLDVVNVLEVFFVRHFNSFHRSHYTLCKTCERKTIALVRGYSFVSLLVGIDDLNGDELSVFVFDDLVSSGLLFLDPSLLLLILVLCKAGTKDIGNDIGEGHSGGLSSRLGI